MRMKKQKRGGTFLFFIFIFYFFFFIFNLPLFAYPDTERTISSLSAPPLDFNFASTPTGFVLSSDNRYLIVGYAETLQIVDLASFALASNQPPAFTETDETDGQIQDMAFLESGNKIVVAQDDGDILVMDFDTPTASYDSYTLSAGSSLDLIAADPDGDDQVYVVENSAKRLHVFDISDQSVTHTVTIPAVTLGGTINV